MLKGKSLLAYTAGIIDGEGSIIISRSGYYKLRVQVGITEEWLPRWLQMNFGGSIHHEQHNHQPSWKDCYRWVICSNQAKDFLKHILPFLQIKRSQAELAIAFQEKRNTRGHKISSEEQAFQEAQSILMSSYNKKGKEIRT